MDFFDSKDITDKTLQALKQSPSDELSLHDVSELLAHSGLRSDDQRIHSFLENLQKTPSDRPISAKTLSQASSSCSSLIGRSLTGQLIIPDFKGFCEKITSLFEETAKNKKGAVADYIPQLKSVPEDQFAVSICTVDGQRFSIGDYNQHFSVQSCSKPLNYLLALKEKGEEYVHRYIGREPSGHSFNEITLDPMHRPHNPMINAGAIASGAMIKNEDTPAERFDHVMQHWRKITGGTTPFFNNAVFLSEKETADRNYALAYFMREQGGLHPQTNLQETLDFYMQCCAVELTTDAFSVAASTLANGGQCTITGERVFSSIHTQHCLSLMYSCGMYNFSGEWAFSIGLPAKSGVGGGIFLVIPGVMGICIWSPKLDEYGNSVRGVEFCKKLVQQFQFHQSFTAPSASFEKEDPLLRKSEVSLNTTAALCWAAALGDLQELKQLYSLGANLNSVNYDQRTALHIAASEGHFSCVQFLVQHGAHRNKVDRWGQSPLDEAKHGKHHLVMDLLQKSQ